VSSGQIDEALLRYEQLLEEYATPTPDRAAVLDALGAVETSRGRYDDAAAHLDEAVSIHAALGDLTQQSAVLNRAGLARLFAGEYAGAEAIFLEATALSAAAGNAEAEAEQTTNLGNVYYFLGRYTEAADAYDFALELANTHLEEPWAARRKRLSLINTATLDQRLGRDRQALARYQELEAEAVALRPRETAQLLSNRGVLLRRLGDPIKALETYDQALDLVDLPGAIESFSAALDRATEAGSQREMLQAQLYRGETRRRMTDLALARQDFTASLSLARELETPEEEWKSLLGLGRVAALDRPEEAVAYFEQAVAVVETIRESIRVPFLRSDFFSDKREVYDALIGARLQDGAPGAEIFSLIERSHSRAWRERLQLTADVDLADIQGRLEPGTALLDYWMGEDGAALVLVRPHEVTVTRLEVPTQPIRELIDRVSRRDPSDVAEAAATLGNSLFPPGVLDATDRVIVVADGPLALVPFEVLSIDGRMLIEHVAVSYVPTAALLLRPERPVPGLGMPWQASLTAFADPVVTRARLDDPAAIQVRLEASLEEATGIAAQLGGVSRVLSGAENRKARLFDHAAPVLHLATHAIADGDALEQSRILFSAAEGAEPGTADYLFLREAYELQLEDVELAVLSACETARGRLVRGEGVQSFSRAFLAAGARSTVTTLWRVPDQPTADFMRAFYYHLQRGETRAEALRAAKLRFIESGSDLADPHYWAAFVLSGEASSPVPRAIKWRTVAFGALLLGALTGVVMLGRRRRTVR
jgi:tetratricopeptide (TPR) repeat protein